MGHNPPSCLQQGNTCSRSQRVRSTFIIASFYTVVKISLVKTWAYTRSLTMVLWTQKKGGGCPRNFSSVGCVSRTYAQWHCGHIHSTFWICQVLSQGLCSRGRPRTGESGCRLYRCQLRCTWITPSQGIVSDHIFPESWDDSGHRVYGAAVTLSHSGLVLVMAGGSFIRLHQLYSHSQAEGTLL